LINCVLWLLAGLVFAITIIGLPFSRSAVEIAKMSAFPFGKEVVHVRDLNGEDGDNFIMGGVLGFLLNLLWLFTFGYSTIPFARCVWDHRFHLYHHYTVRRTVI
jgi:uncharacterized membrane protein YccF (DUF307 family)